MCLLIYSSATIIPLHANPCASTAPVVTHTHTAGVLARAVRSTNRWCRPGFMDRSLTGGILSYSSVLVVHVPLYKAQCRCTQHSQMSAWWQTGLICHSARWCPAFVQTPRTRRAFWNSLKILSPGLTRAFDRHSRWLQWHEWSRKEVSHPAPFRSRWLAEMVGYPDYRAAPALRVRARAITASRFSDGLQPEWLLTSMGFWSVMYECLCPLHFECWAPSSSSGAWEP